MAEKVSDSEESKVGSEERSRLEAEPSAPPKDPKQTELPSSRSSLKGEPSLLAFSFIVVSVSLGELQTVCIHSGALQRNGEVFRKAEQ